MKNEKKVLNKVPQKSAEKQSQEIPKRIECEHYAPHEMELYKFCKGYVTAEDHSHQTLW
jgi:hypothetical protein